MIILSVAMCSCGKKLLKGDNQPTVNDSTPAWSYCAYYLIFSGVVLGIIIIRESYATLRWINNAALQLARSLDRYAK